MHQKESVIAPILEKALGVEIIIPDSSFNTDTFGTFSGEVERTVDPIEAAQLKCIKACQLYDCSLAVASEGSFGPHPTLFFVPGDDEILVFIDLENKIEIRARELSTATNFAGSLFTSWDDIKAFAAKALFPSHALILRSEKDDTTHLTKGIDSWEALEQHCSAYLSQYGQVFVETDMRAMHNPSRMRVIEAATQKLADKILSTCPQCHWPGFDVVDVRAGLPCSWCGSPTNSTLCYTYQCKKCNHTEEKLYPHGKQTEEPTFCDYCNP
jgi:hypothetical protein